jgi:hypothetical protein
MGFFVKNAKTKRDKGSDHGGLDAWFSGHGQGKSKAKGKAPYGDWIAITPVKNTVEKADGEKKTFQAGDIVGPCGISKKPEWKDITNNGKDPLKCMPRQKAHDLSKAERAELAKNKRKKEKNSPDTGKPVNTPTFGEKAKKIKKKALIEEIASLERIANAYYEKDFPNTLAQVRSMIKKKYPKLDLARGQGQGYYYFFSDDDELGLKLVSLDTTSVYVYSVKQLTFADWMKEADEVMKKVG